MIRRVPLLPTLVVLIAVGIMLRLGFWQIGRMHEKAEMLARYESAEGLAAEVQWRTAAATAEPGKADAWAAALYRRSRLECMSVAGMSSVAGQNARGEAGFAHIAQCVLADGGRAPVVLGWSRQPQAPEWQGGSATGWIAPGPRLVADPPLAGLDANARPDPRDIPNNHLAYAVQWFAFAVVALVIYALALRKRWRS